MLVIGLTGGIGSGKTTVANLFAVKGIPIIDTDQLARDVTQPNHPGLTAIVEKFGTGILLADHSLNRRELRNIIFADARQRLWLEKLLHPLIREEMSKQLNLLEKSANPSAYCIVVIPLLFENEPNPLIQKTLAVDSPKVHQIARTKKRDQVSEDDVEAIMRTQVSQQHRLEHADDIIYNDSTLEHLSEQVDQLHQKYLLFFN